MKRIALLLLILTTPAHAQSPVYLSDQNGVPWSASNPLPVSSNSAASVTPVAPDVSTVTTGGTAVTAFSATHVAKGGYLQNPTAATAALCVSLTGTAAATSAGGTSCIAAGSTFSIPPMAGAVSVNSSDSAHTFSGTGFK